MPKWVDDCVKGYVKSGMSTKEAWERCMGAKAKRDKKKKGKK